MSARETFWAYSCRVYGAEGVPAACIALQDDCGLDVSLLLYCCWTGRRGLQLRPATLAAVLAFAVPWREQVVQPLRDARRWMKRHGCNQAGVSKTACAALRESIKALELESERVQQETLEAMTTRAGAAATGAALDDMIANLQLYLKSAGIALDPAMHAQLAAVLAVAAGTSPGEVLRRLRDLPTGPDAGDG